MQVLALERSVPGRTASDFGPHLAREAHRVWELQQAGVLREIHFRQDRDDAVLLLECAGPDEARRILATLPLVLAGLVEFEVIPLRPYPGMARLFAC